MFSFALEALRKPLSHRPPSCASRPHPACRWHAPPRSVGLQPGILQQRTCAMCTVVSATPRPQMDLRGAMPSNRKVTDRGPPARQMQTGRALASSVASADTAKREGSLLAGKSALVVGGGPAGMLAAMQLAHQGASVQVFEARPFDYEERKNRWFVVLNAQGLAALRAAGIDVAKAPPQLRLAGLNFVSGDGKCIGAGWGMPARGICCTRGMLTRYVQEEALRLYPSIALRHGCKLLTGSLRAGKLELENLDSGQHFEEQGDVLVGADGAHSLMRRLMAEQVPGFSFDAQPHYGGIFSFPLRKLPAVGERNSLGKPFELFPDGDDRREWLGKGTSITFVWPRDFVRAKCYVSLNVFESGNVDCALSMPLDDWDRKYSEESARQLITSQLPQLPNSIVSELAKELSHSPTPRPLPTSIRCSAISAPGVLLVGDAAHAMSPAAGRGANSALEDSLNIRNAIAQAGGSIEEMCRLYNRQRLEDVRAMVDGDRLWVTRPGRSPNPASWLARALAFTVASLTHSLWR